jgi:purine catabolism regulator
MLLALQRDIAAKQVEARYRNEFVHDLVTGNIRHHEEVLNRAKTFGWNLLGKLRAVVFDIDDYKSHFERPLPKEKAAVLEETKERVYSICKNEMRSIFHELPYFTMSDFIVFIVNVGDSRPGAAPPPRGPQEDCPAGKGADFNFKAELQRYCKAIQDEIKSRTKFSVSVGVGDEKNDFFGVAESYNEARGAIEMMRPLNGSGGFHVWDEMGVLTVLAPAAQSEEARKFLISRLGKLLGAHDLLHTLNILVEQDWNFKAAARKLHIHYNTIHYRYEKICELSDLDLSTGETRLEMAVALKLLRLNPKLHE